MIKIILTLFFIIFFNFGYSAPTNSNIHFLVSGKIYLEAQIKSKILNLNYVGTAATANHDIEFQWYKLKGGNLNASFLCNNKKTEIIFTQNELIAASKCVF